MYDKSQTTAIFSAAQSGLQTTIQYLFQQNKDGVTQANLNTAVYNNTTGINSSFFQMVNSQFATLDKNHDGTLTTDEANAMLNNLSTGLSRDQILQLRASGSIDEELASKIIANFAKIDQNGDGKVSESEINAYCFKEDIADKENEQIDHIISNMTCFYGSDSSSDIDSDTETSSKNTSLN